MVHRITIKCPACGHTWQVEYEQLQRMCPVYRGDPKQTRIEEYHFTCPQDGTQFIKCLKVTADRVEEE